MKNSREIDALYRPLPRFAEWAACQVNEQRWLRFTERLKAFKGQSPDMFERAREVVKRATAIDTGALEGLYDVDRGFTISVAMETALWEARIGERGEEAKGLIESQLRAYDYVLDFATESVPIAEAWIRKLHEEICAGQPTYRVLTEAGFQNQNMPKGEYKHHSNHVEKKDGALHAYAPVDETPHEMRKLVEELRSERFVSGHPLLQAAYAHYGLVWIHPFADGNGRTARALASVFTYRAVSIPLMVLADRKAEYLDSLAGADQGNPQAFVDFVLERIIDAVELIEDSFRHAGAPTVADLVRELNSVYVTKGGYSHEEVNEAGKRLSDVFLLELKKVADQQSTPHLQVDISWGGIRFTPRDNYRGSGPDGTNCVHLSLNTKYPAAAYQREDYALELPIDCDKDDCIALSATADSNSSIEIRMSDLVPEVSVAAQLRIRMFAESAFALQLKAILKESQAALRSNKQQ